MNPQPDERPETSVPTRAGRLANGREVQQRPLWEQNLRALRPRRPPPGGRTPSSRAGAAGTPASRPLPTAPAAGRGALPGATGAESHAEWRMPDGDPAVAGCRRGHSASWCECRSLGAATGRRGAACPEAEMPQASRQSPCTCGRHAGHLLLQAPPISACGRIGEPPDLVCGCGLRLESRPGLCGVSTGRRDLTTAVLG